MAQQPDTPVSPQRRWPAYVITAYVGMFCAIVAVAWAWDHLVRGTSIDAEGWIIAGATVLRMVTIVIALAAVRPWGRLLPATLLTIGLWGCAAAQIAYPLAETVVKAAVLAGLVDWPNRGIGNLTAVGWFNFAMVWLVFGLPGVLFAMLARDHQRRHAASWLWPAAGLVGGTAALFGVGLLIG